MSWYVRKDGLRAQTDITTPCRCGDPGCSWTEADDIERDKIEAAERVIAAEDARAAAVGKKWWQL